MRILKLLFFSVLTIFAVACGSNSNQVKSDFSIKINSPKNKVKKNTVLSLTIDNPKQHRIDSVVYFYNDSKVNEELNLIKSDLGKQTIEAIVYFNDESQKTSKRITVLNDESPKIYKFNIINEFPHDITSYTQGLEFHNGILYESTGQRGESKLRAVDYKTGEVLENIDLSNSYFGEGLTVLNDKIYQLTWQSKIGFVYSIDPLTKINSFKYGKSKEGWGICNDGTNLYKSDGSEKVWILDPETLVEQEYIQVYTNKSKVVGLNEMEWIDGKIYANRYQKNGVAIINPDNGAIEGVVDFSSLKNKVTQHDKLDVLNGIAYNPDTKTIFVTGKRWDKLFEVEIVEK